MAIQLKEQSTAQTHFNDICALVGHPDPLAYNPDGTQFTFEMRTDEGQGKHGRADVWYRGKFIWEYKGPGKDLDKAYQQLLRYREALDNPPLLITSDTNTIIIHTNFTGTVKETHKITFDRILSAVTIYADTMTHRAKAAVNPADPAQVLQTQGAVMRFEALRNEIHVPADKDAKLHTWLSANEVKRLVAAIVPPAYRSDDTAERRKEINAPKCKRDRLVIGRMVGAGLRRNEVVTVDCADVGKLTESRRAITVHGKGDKSRIVPISDRLADIINEWCAEIGGGRLARSVTQRGDIGDSLSTVAVYKIVKRYGAAIGRPELEPHDLRRTFANIARQNDVSIEQISKLLGHANIETTMRYLNVQIDATVTASDFVPL